MVVHGTPDIPRVRLILENVIHRPPNRLGIRPVIWVVAMGEQRHHGKAHHPRLIPILPWKTPVRILGGDEKFQPPLIDALHLRRHLRPAIHLKIRRAAGLRLRLWCGCGRRRRFRRLLAQDDRSHAEQGKAQGSNRESGLHGQQ
jgi:hypothetical protein